MSAPARRRLWADFAEDGRLRPIDGSRGGRTGRRAGGWRARRDDLARPRRVPDRPVRPRLGHPPGPVRDRHALASPLHRVRRDVRPERLGDRRRGRPLRRDEWAAAIDAWQAPILADPGRPDWYKGALFNELYYMVDGGTLWTDGPPILPDRPDGPTPTTGPTDAGGPIGRFAQIECFDYPFYNTLDVDFYASFARLQLWPELERAVIREFVASVEAEDPAIVEIQWSGKMAPRKCPGALPHDVGGPARRPAAASERLPLPGHQHLEGPELQVRPPAVARRECPGRRRPAPRRLARGSSGRWSTSPRSTATATACPSTTATRTRPTTRGR
jgi:hypothetical protein